MHASAPAEAPQRGGACLPSPGGAEYPGGSPGWSPRGPRPLWSPGGGFGGFGTPPRARDDAEGRTGSNYHSDDGGLPSLSLLNTPLGMSSTRCDANHTLRLFLHAYPYLCPIRTRTPSPNS